MNSNVLSDKNKRNTEEATTATTKGYKRTCAICKGMYSFPAETAHGIYPDRKLHPDLFICWECVHWLFKVFMDHIVNYSYCYLFNDKAPNIGKYSSRVIRNEKIIPTMERGKR